MRRAERPRPAAPCARRLAERAEIRQKGFASGNTPRGRPAARDRRVIFTTTTGAGRLVQCRGAHAVYMGTTVNSTGVVKAAQSHGRDVVVIPAGLMTDPTFPAQEDWVAAAVIAAASGSVIGEGRTTFELWRDRIQREGVPALFQSAPHAAKLRKVKLEADISICAEVDSIPAVPVVTDWNALGGILSAWS